MMPVSAAALAAVAAGGAVGSLARFLAGIAVTSWLGLHIAWATLGVNVVGGFLIGLIAEALARSGLDGLLRPLLITGFLGGFTTFSAFSLEVVTLSRAEPLIALGYALVSVLACVFACAGGIALVRAFA